MAMALNDSANATARSNVSSLHEEHRLTATAIIAPISHNTQNRFSLIRFISVIDFELW